MKLIVSSSFAALTLSLIFLVGDIIPTVQSQEHAALLPADECDWIGRLVVLFLLFDYLHLHLHLLCLYFFRLSSSFFPRHRFSISFRESSFRLTQSSLSPFLFVSFFLSFFISSSRFRCLARSPWHP